MSKFSNQRTLLISRDGLEDKLAFYKYQLVVSQGKQQGSEFVLDKDIIRLGTGSNCDVILEDGTVSRQHLEIRVTEDGHLIRDLESTNGTQVEGCRIREAFLHPGARITAGEVELVFQPLNEKVEVKLSTQDSYGRMFGRSLKMRAVFHLAQRVAAKDTTVLITGETGTGKGLLAEEIHTSSHRNRSKLVIVDCTTIPTHLMESELFGHVRGAFTGAVNLRRGAFENAHQGTIFFDEIGELPLHLQPKLLRVLETQEIKKLGETESTKVDVRILAATNRNLKTEVDLGKFREDLFYRLGVFEINIPPLRERKDDIPDLAREFLQTIDPDHERKISDDAMRYLNRHEWPGNVRELHNIIERAVHLSDEKMIETASLMSSTISAFEKSDNDLDPNSDIANLTFHQAKELAEQKYLIELLSKHQNNVSLAAKTAQIHRQSLHRLLRKHRIKSSELNDSEN